MRAHLVLLQLLLLFFELVKSRLDVLEQVFDLVALRVWRVRFCQSPKENVPPYKGSTHSFRP